MNLLCKYMFTIFVYLMNVCALLIPNLNGIYTMHFKKNQVKTQSGKSLKAI